MVSGNLSSPLNLPVELQSWGVGGDADALGLHSHLPLEGSLISLLKPQRDTVVGTFQSSNSV